MIPFLKRYANIADETASYFEGAITSTSASNSGTMCSVNVDTLVFFDTLVLINGSRVFTNTTLTSPFIGDTRYYHFFGEDNIHKRGTIDSDGVITNIGNC